MGDKLKIESLELQPLAVARRDEDFFETFGTSNLFVSLF